MNTDEKIKAAAEAFAKALSEGGESYYINTHQMDATCIEGKSKRYTYNISVVEQNDRMITDDIGFF